MIARLALLLFALRAAMPVGYMPDLGALRDGRFEIVICTPAGPKTVEVDAEERPTEPTNPDRQDTSASIECPFQAAVSKAVVVPDLTSIRAAHAYRPALPSRSAERTLTAPSQGPPLGSRAPPTDLV